MTLDPSQATTPSFSGAPIPGIGGGVGAQTQPDPNAKAQQILAQLLQAAQRKQMANTAVPRPMEQMTDPREAQNIGMNTAWPRAWGTQRFLGGLAANIKNAVAKQKNDQLLKAEGDWTYLQSAMNDKFQAEQSGDQAGVQAAEAKLQVIMGDPKKLKNMAKALNQDWLNPEKTTVYGEALKRVAAQSQQKDKQDQQKQGAAQKLKQSFMGLLKQKQQLQLTADEQKRMAQEIEKKAPTSGPDLKQVQELARTNLELEQAQKAAKENYYPPVADENGHLWSVSKTNPKDVVPVRDTETGQQLKGIPKGGAPKLLMNGGVPFAVARNGKTITPGSPEWNKDDQKLLDAGMGAAKEKQRLRLPPEIAAQIGEPPNPSDYAKGRSDPAYGKALAAYGKEAEKIKAREAEAGGVARAIAWNQYHVVDTMDAEGNVYKDWAKNAIGQVSGSEGIKLLSREKQMEDIEVASGKFRSSINELDKPFTPDQIAKIYLATTTEDEGLAKSEMSALASQKLTEKQQDFVIWMQQMNERAMSLRSVAGMGQGAQDLRNAIRGMIPGIRSGSTQMMNKQLDAIDNQVKILHSGIAHAGKAKGDDAKKKDPLGIL